MSKCEHVIAHAAVNSRFQDRNFPGRFSFPGRDVSQKVDSQIVTFPEKTIPRW